MRGSPRRKILSNEKCSLQQGRSKPNAASLADSQWLLLQRRAAMSGRRSVVNFEIEFRRLDRFGVIAFTQAGVRSDLDVRGPARQGEIDMHIRFGLGGVVEGRTPVGTLTIRTLNLNSTRLCEARDREQRRAENKYLIQKAMALDGGKSRPDAAEAGRLAIKGWLDGHSQFSLASSSHEPMSRVNTLVEQKNKTQYETQPLPEDVRARAPNSSTADWTPS
jgi:hypothetical protein